MKNIFHIIIKKNILKKNHTSKKAVSVNHSLENTTNSFEIVVKKKLWFQPHKCFETFAECVQET